MAVWTNAVLSTQRCDVGGHFALQVGLELKRWLVRLKSIAIAFCGYKLLVFTFEVKQTLVSFLIVQSVLKTLAHYLEGFQVLTWIKKCCALRMTGYWLELMVHILIFGFAVSWWVSVACSLKRLHSFARDCSYLGRLVPVNISNLKILCLHSQRFCSFLQCNEKDSNNFFQVTWQRFILSIFMPASMLSFIVFMECILAILSPFCVLTTAWRKTWRLLKR